MERYKELIGHCYYKGKNIYTIRNIIFLNNDYIIEYIDNGHIKYDRLDELDMEIFYQDYLTRKERVKILDDRNINDIVHFTKVSNIDNILEYGLMARDTLDLLDIDYSYSDDVRLDDKLNFISTSITFPNYKMFYTKRCENSREEWAVIKISPSIIVHKLNTEFYQENRAKLKLYKTDDYYRTNEAFESLFTKENRSLLIPDNYTTNPQAEVMVKNEIDTKYITSIETQGENRLVKSLTRNANVPYNPHSRLFTYRRDFERWR